MNNLIFANILMLPIICSGLYFLFIFLDDHFLRKSVREKNWERERERERERVERESATIFQAWCICRLHWRFYRGSLVVVSMHTCDCLHCNDTSCAQAMQTFIPDYALHEYQVRLWKVFQKLEGRMLAKK